MENLVDVDGLRKRLALAEAVVEAARPVSDSNWRRLEESLRKSSWGEQADDVQVFRKALAAYREAGEG